MNTVYIWIGYKCTARFHVKQLAMVIGIAIRIGNKKVQGLCSQEMFQSRPITISSDSDLHHNDHFDSYLLGNGLYQYRTDHHRSLLKHFFEKRPWNFSFPILISILMTTSTRISSGTGCTSMKVQKIRMHYTYVCSIDLRLCLCAHAPVSSICAYRGRVHIHLYTCTRMHIHPCTYTHSHMHVHPYTYTHMYRCYVHTDILIHTQVIGAYVSASASIVNICICIVQMHVYIQGSMGYMVHMYMSHVYMHIHKYIHAYMHI